VAIWYKKHEQPLRQAAWLAASGLGGIVGSIAIFGIGHIHGDLPAWKYQFLILGAVTVVWGAAVALFLPDNPTEARFLTAEQKVIAIERMRAGQTGIENTHFKLYQVKEALLDIKNLLFVVIILCVQLTNGASGGFVTIIARSLGFNAFQSVLFVGCLGAVTLVALPTAG
jgi:MFS family permease